MKDDSEQAEAAEDVVDNDEGEDLLLQKIAEEISAAQQQQQKQQDNEVGDYEAAETDESSRELIMFNNVVIYREIY